MLSGRQRRGVRSPGIPRRVDYSHPLAQGLQAAYCFDAGFHDVVGSNNGTRAGNANAPAWIASPAGGVATQWAGSDLGWLAIPSQNGTLRRC
jgi:hypothetical protein